MVQHESLQKL